jgi:hypothetical protein
MNEQSKDLVKKRLQTTMIGALHEFEKSFGYLWGQDKELEELTEREDEFRYIWENTRNNILNNGNDQLRKCLLDLEKNNNYNKTYHYKFYKKGNHKE